MRNILLKKYLIENAQTDSMVTLIANNDWIEYTLRYMVDYKKRRTHVTNCTAAYSKKPPEVTVRLSSPPKPLHSSIR